MKRAILANATKLRKLAEDDQFARVYIRPDLTPKQQVESKNLYTELTKVRDRNPTKTYKIKRGTIMEVLPQVDPIQPVVDPVQQVAEPVQQIEPTQHQV